VITVVSLLIPESSERAQKLLFGKVRNYSLLTTFFMLMNEENGWINFQKQVYGKLSKNFLFFRNFEDILVQKKLYLILFCP